MIVDDEVEFIRSENLSRIAKAHRTLMVVEIDGCFEVHDHTPTGVSPVSVYQSKQKAAARLLQLLKIGPVAPQTWPEVACIGKIDTDDAEGQP